MSNSQKNTTSSVQKASSKAILFWSLGALFFGYEFLLRVSPNVMQEELRDFFNIDATMLGLLSSAYYYGYAIFQIPSGLLIDRYGARFFLAVGAVMCGGGAVMIAATDAYALAWIGRFLIGAGSAFALIGTLKISAEWFSPDRYGLLTGCTLMIGVTGALFSSKPLAWSVDSIGWQNTLIYIGLAGIALAVAIYMIVRDKKDALTVDAEGHSTAGKEVLVVLKNPQSWIVGFFGGALYVPINVLAELWGTPFLMEQCTCSKGDAAYALSFMFIGIAVGSPFIGWISDSIHRRKLVALVGTLFSLVLSLIVIFIPMCSLITFGALVFILGAVLGCQILMFPIIRELNPSHVSGFTAGFCNTIAMGMTSAFQPLVGWILDTLNGKVDCADKVTYSLESLRSGLIVVPVILAAAAILLLFIRETYAKPLEEQDFWKNNAKN